VFSKLLSNPIPVSHRHEAHEDVNDYAKTINMHSDVRTKHSSNSPVAIAYHSRARIDTLECFRIIRTGNNSSSFEFALNALNSIPSNPFHGRTFMVCRRRPQTCHRRRSPYLIEEAQLNGDEIRCSSGISMVTFERHFRAKSVS
jgi:hypothetical protein